MGRRLVFLAVLAVVAGGLWVMQRTSQPQLLIEDARAIPVPGAAHSVMVTLTIRNAGGPDRLIDVAAPNVRLAVLKSLDTRGLPIPAESAPSLAMEAGHIMLMGLETAPDDGTLLPLTLEFSRSGSVQTKARVMNNTMSHGDAVPWLDGAPPVVSITVSGEGAGWRVRHAVTNFTFSRDQVDGPHVPGTGHGHLYLDGIKLGRVFGEETTIGALLPGTHKIEFRLFTNDHRAYHVGGAAIMGEAEFVSP